MREPDVNPPSIVPMGESHMGGVVEIERASFGTPWSRESFNSVIENPSAVALVALVGGEVAGYACALVAGEEADVLKLAVAARFRRKGLGRMLNEACLDELRRRGCRRAYLEVRRSNSAAIALYESAGFVAEGVRKGYYESPAEDALVMRRSL